MDNIGARFDFEAHHEQPFSEPQKERYHLSERERLMLAAEALLVLERQTTNADIVRERKQSATDAKLAADFLESEIGAHGQTKAFLAIVSHDLRNPLSSISMSAEILAEALTAPKIDSTEALQMVGIIQRNAAVMDRLITDLLDVERMAAGKIEMNLAPYSVQDLFAECADVFGLLAAKRSIQFVTKTESSLWACVDRDRVRQVMSNLLSNAFKHTSAGGIISLEARRQGNEVEVSVVDSGSGIPEKDQTRIFEKFSQLENRSRQGLGLGLHISKWIVEAHGGKIWVDSKLGHGSKFTFTLLAS